MVKQDRDRSGEEADAGAGGVRPRAGAETLVVRKPAAPCEPVPREKCAVLVPALAWVEPACEESLRILETRGYVVRRLRGNSQIDMARSRMASDALL
ncbi:MAG TPA: hypothetical protein VFW87_03755, partial [Pirellulales bacterium]|nr:hypothetical protein [Pirellulales bacterium]